MSNIKLINLVFALCLTACGGSNESAAPTPAPIVEPPIKAPLTTYYQPDAPQAGDSYTYLSSSGFSNFDGTPQTRTDTEQVGRINDDGSFFITTFDGQTNVKLSDKLLDAKRNIIKNYGCNNSPAQNLLPIPWYVGKISRQNISVTCPSYVSDSESMSKISSTAKVLAYEPVTVKAGTFNSLKVQIVEDTNNWMGSYLIVIPSHEEKTCWYDVKSGFVVKCTSDLTFDFSNLDTDSVTMQILIALIGSDVNHSTQELIATNKSSDTAFALTGSLNNATIADLYLTPNKSQQLNVNTKNTFKFETTQPVRWSVTSSNGTTQLSSNVGIVVDGVPITLHSSDKVLTATISDPIFATTNLVNLRVNGTLIFDPTKTVSVDVMINTGMTTPLPIPIPPSNCTGSLKFC